MLEHLQTFLLVLSVGAAVAIGAKRFNVPYNVALVVFGLLLVVANVLPHTPMDPEIILMVFLPMLVFEGALSADADSMISARRPILALAIPGVAVSLLGTAMVAALELDLPFSIALLLGALLSITDTVSVLLAFRAVRVPHRLAAIMEGESLFNDGTALVLVSLATSVVLSGTFHPVTTLRDLAVAMIGGLALGAIFGALGAIVLRRTPDHLTAILASIVLVFATAIMSERVHASPIIAVVTSGLIIGRAARRVLEPARVLALEGFWETTGFLINVILFLLVGMQIDARMLLSEAVSIALALLAVHAGRALAVYGFCTLLRLTAKERIPMKWQHVMVIGNIKGALSMAAVLALPAAMPGRERLITIVFGVTFVTLVVQALPFQRLLHVLGVSVSAANLAIDQARATLVTARKGHSEIEDMFASGLISRIEHATLRALYQRRVIEAEHVLRGREGQGARDHFVESTLLNAQKAALLDAVRRGIVAAEAAAEPLNEMDKKLMDLARREAGEDA